jgi:hypothetical protein
VTSWSLVDSTFDKHRYFKITQGYYYQFLKGKFKRYPPKKLVQNMC